MSVPNSALSGFVRNGTTSPNNPNNPPSYLDSLATDIRLGQSLLVYCTRRSRKLVVPNNVEVKKIPRDLLQECDYAEDVK